MKHYGDITLLSGRELPIVDCIIGGSPCQDLSLAGTRAGLGAERSGLFMEQIRIVREMRERDRLENGRSGFLCRPRFLGWENVPGAFSSNGGRDFQTVLTEIVRIADPGAPDVPMPQNGRWPKAGCLYDDLGRWSVAWAVHNAAEWGVPQRRVRISVVADFGGLSAPEVCFEREGLSWRPPKEPGKRENPPESVRGSADQAGLCFPNVANTLTERYDGSPDPAKGRGGNIVLSVGNGQMAGITMKPIANTLDTMHDQQAVLIAEQETAGVRTFSFQRSDEYKESDKAKSVLARDYKDATDLVVAAVDCRNGTENEKYNGTLQAKETGQSLNSNNVVRQNMIVRRLTPLECERLQGYPDGWTDIGDWVDSKGKRHKAADSPRYKSLGNSIALPYWFRFCRRISAQFDRPATLGSLFDGIGGFPLCWERCNGPGTAIWASEIDEFCIAVTRRHFPEEGEDHG